MKNEAKGCRVTLLLLVTALAWSSAAVADNWMRSEDELYFKGGFEYEHADARWDRHGTLQQQSCVTSNWKHDQSYEYGLSYYHTLFGSFEYMRRACGGVADSGLGDIDVGIRGRLNPFRNGRSWEIGTVIPTGDTAFGLSSHTARRYALRLGLFGSLGKSTIINGQPSASVEMGGNIFIWQGSAPEQFSGYLKYNWVPGKESMHYFAAVEANYALIDRDKIADSEVNARETYGYDTVKLRLGLSSRVSLYWRMTFELSDVLKARNASDSSAVKLSFSKMLMD